MNKSGDFGVSPSFPRPGGSTTCWQSVLWEGAWDICERMLDTWYHLMLVTMRVWLGDVTFQFIASWGFWCSTVKAGIWPRLLTTSFAAALQPATQLPRAISGCPGPTDSMGWLKHRKAWCAFYHQRDFPWFPDEFSSSIGPFSSADGRFSPRQLMSRQQGLQGEATAPSWTKMRRQVLMKPRDHSAKAEPLSCSGLRISLRRVGVWGNYAAQRTCREYCAGMSGPQEQTRPVHSDDLERLTL